MIYLALFLLVFCSITDILNRTVCFRILILFLCIAVLFMAAGLMLADKNILIYEPSVISISEALLPGILLLAVGFISEEKIGYGDGFIVLILGIMLGLNRVVFCLIISLLLSAGVSVFLLATKKCSKSYALPFVPFLLAGVIIELIGMWLT